MNKPENELKYIADTFNLEVIRYYDAENNPTCAVDFKNNLVCKFYLTQKFGCWETCFFADQNGKYKQILNRRKGGNGTLIPLENCPLWQKK